MQNATQLSLETGNRFSKKTTVILLIMAPLLGLVFAFFLTRSPDELKIMALEILANQEAWWTEQGKINEYDAQIDALEVLKATSMQTQAALSTENDTLRNSINSALSGF